MKEIKKGLVAIVLLHLTKKPVINLSILCAMKLDLSNTTTKFSLIVNINRTIKNISFYNTLNISSYISFYNCAKCLTVVVIRITNCVLS